MAFSSKFRGQPGDDFRLIFLPQMIKGFLLYKTHTHIYICIYTHAYIYFIKYPAETKTLINHSLKLKGYT